MEIIFDTEKEKDDLCRSLVTAGRCPALFNFNQSCNRMCVECWKRAFRNMKVKDKDYRKEAEKMISDGTVVKSGFYDILVNELAKQLEEDDNKKWLKEDGEDK